MVDALPSRPVKGRGATDNRVGRFEPHDRIAVDDGWFASQELLDAPGPQTSLHIDTARTIIARNQSPDVPFDRSINPYRGCEHGCVYCFARPSHAYLGLSPGLDFETQIFHKPDAARLLARELSRPGYRPQPIAIGANTDPYQPIERTLMATRSVLETLSASRHPFVIITKSSGVLRDLDLIAPMAAERMALVCVSITTLDGQLARLMEPRAPGPQRRLETIRRLAAAGVPVAVLVSPIVPALTDHEMEQILEAAAGAGARHANYIVLRLPHEIAGILEDWLRTHYPDRADRVLNRMRELRGGALYVAEFGRRMRGDGIHADLLAARFAKACARTGLKRREWDLDTTQFSPPRSGPNKSGPRKIRPTQIRPVSRRSSASIVLGPPAC